VLTRSLLLASAAIVALALAATPAAAKEVRSVTVCGPADCASVDDHERLEALMTGGSPSDPPSKPEPWYRAEIEIGGDGGAHESFTINVLPSTGYIRSRDEIGGSVWTEMSAGQQAIYERLTAAMKPFAASGLPGIPKRDHSPAAPQPEPAPSHEPAPSQPAEAGSSAAPWLVAGGALAVLVLVAVIRHRRRHSEPAATG
jgi:MYXO-CTERM domain-containing protein